MRRCLCVSEILIMNKGAVIPFLLTLLSLLFCVSIISTAQDTNFDVRQHLSTVSRYGVVKDTTIDSFVPSSIPDHCSPIHLNLVARHGTRAPTKKKMKDLETLSSHLNILLQNAKEKMSLDDIPSWLWGWSSPWKGKIKGGELISEGEDELYHLGIRIRERFPGIFGENYHPDVYPIKTTQVPRASASAVAFGMGLFRGRGKLGAGKHRAFAVTSESRASDIKLRFHDCCQNYKAFKKSQEPAVQELQEPIIGEITQALVRRYGISFTSQDTSSLWFLCKQEASLLNITNQACALFNPSEVTLLEWTDDLESFILKGYGNTINYRMGVPLLEDVVQSMEGAIIANEEKHAPGNYEKARLRLAHAETLVPFSCLLGLQLEGSEFELIQQEKPLPYPPKPPQARKWKGSIVAPFAGNNILVLHSCEISNNSKSKYFVQVLHNEHPAPMPGCNNSDFCPFEVFKAKIAGPHLMHKYDMVCNVRKPEQKSLTSLFIQFVRWLYQRSEDTRPQKLDGDL